MKNQKIIDREQIKLWKEIKILGIELDAYIELGDLDNILEKANKIRKDIIEKYFTNSIDVELAFQKVIDKGLESSKEEMKNDLIKSIEILNDVKKVFIYDEMLEIVKNIFMIESYITCFEWEK